VNARNLLRKALVSILASIFVVASLTTVSTQNSPKISALAWLAGSWQTAPGGRAQIEEHWTDPAGGSMIGMGRTVAGEKTVEFEFLRIEQRADGIYYVAHPDARCPGTDFKLTRVTPTEVVFENPQHDFPKRITYRKTGDDAITASIDAGEGTRVISFVYRRMK
jgi:Domain of unknown function (DUF6265)